jgi:hypothetical protein
VTASWRLPGDDQPRSIGTGDRFGSLTAVSVVMPIKPGATTWRAVCDCGNVIDVSGAALRDGTARNCGGCVGGRRNGDVPEDALRSSERWTWR